MLYLGFNLNPDYLRRAMARAGVRFPVRLPPRRPILRVAEWGKSSGAREVAPGRGDRSRISGLTYSLGRWLLASAMLALWASASSAGTRAPIRGVVISCQTWGHEWGSDAMVTALHEVKALGANWVQIHPYGRIERTGEISLGRGFEGAETPPWLSRPIREAQALGLKIAVVPHLAGWRAGWSWRGDIHFETDAEWARFFTSYQAWITTLAQMCRDADGFSVGSELDRTIPGHETEWREIIRAVRAETTAPLTYGANWPAYREVSFWDALDAIGVSAYFPLVEHDAAPAAEELDAAWRRWHAELAGFSRAQNRPIVFLELGYDAASTAARQPWVSGPRDASPIERAIQALCLDRALLALNLAQSSTPELAGAFLWKWFPGEARREDYRLQSEPMRQTLLSRWAQTAPLP